MKETTISFGKTIKITQATEDALLTAKITSGTAIKTIVQPLVAAFMEWSNFTRENLGVQVKEITEFKITPNAENMAAVVVKTVEDLGEVPTKCEINFATFSREIAEYTTKNGHNYFMANLYDAAKEVAEKIETQLPALIGMQTTQLEMDF